MSIEYYDVFGTAGVILIVGSYFLLQIGTIRSSSLLYSAYNAAGAALILFSLYFDFNVAAFLIEVFWLLISVIGMIRCFNRRKAMSA